MPITTTPTSKSPTGVPTLRTKTPTGAPTIRSSSPTSKTPTIKTTSPTTQSPVAVSTKSPTVSTGAPIGAGVTMAPTRAPITPTVTPVPTTKVGSLSVDFPDGTTKDAAQTWADEMITAACTKQSITGCTATVNSVGRRLLSVTADIDVYAPTGSTYDNQGTVDLANSFNKDGLIPDSTRDGSAPAPTMKPTNKPTRKPTNKPTMKPTMKPTVKPSTASPTPQPTVGWATRFMFWIWIQNMFTGMFF